ncbi:MAG: hypothetical protein LBH03_04300 [Holophagales bacterium]|jgi:hypothetical protein|nr:hypothetical protein [Holophagales bacterium]
MSKNFQTALSKVAVSLAMLVSGLVSTAQSRNQGRREAPPQRPPRVEGATPRPIRAPESSMPDRQARPFDNSRSGRQDARPDVSRRPPQLQSPDKPVRPRPLPRLKVFPTFYYWDIRYNSIYNDMMFISRRGYIPVTAIPPDTYEIVDYAELPAGWRGYGLVVPPGESVIINLEHPNRGWFRLIICDTWGQAVPGGLNSTMPQFEPRLTYKNPGVEAKAIYLIVDDPGWMSNEGSPYTIEIERSWEPDLVPVNQNLIVSGIWGIDRSINAKFRGPVLVMPGFK